MKTNKTATNLPNVADIAETDAPHLLRGGVVGAWGNMHCGIIEKGC
ncbi:MAG: hypothetical protein QMD22_08485 [archaeon]|nr:hypothetical protein [archaeon]